MSFGPRVMGTMSHGSRRQQQVLEEAPCSNRGGERDGNSESRGWGPEIERANGQQQPRLFVLKVESPGYEKMHSSRD